MAANEPKLIEVYVMIDENGEVVVATDREALQEAYDENVGDTIAARRIISIAINVPLPKPTDVIITMQEEPQVETIQFGYES